MSPDQLTPADVVVANVRIYMRWRGLTQEELADRMTSIGMGFGKKKGGKTEWHRRTVGQMLSGDRRVDVNELFALGEALETTVPTLLSPDVGGIVDFDAEYCIGELDPLRVSDFEILLEGMPEKEARPRLVVEGWLTGLSDMTLQRRKRLLAKHRPRWARQRTPFAQKLFDDLEALRVRYPNVDFDRATGAEILALVEEDSQEV